MQLSTSKVPQTLLSSILIYRPPSSLLQKQCLNSLVHPDIGLTVRQSRCPHGEGRNHRPQEWVAWPAMSEAVVSGQKGNVFNHGGLCHCRQTDCPNALDHCFPCIVLPCSYYLHIVSSGYSWQLFLTSLRRQ